MHAGYDLAFIAAHGLTDQDLDCVGIPLTKLGLRRKLLARFNISSFTHDEEDEDESESEGDREEDDDEEEEEGA